jgi:putative ABC transport system ATP-binding protein
MITMKNITKTYEMGTQTVHALRGVDLQLREGEFVAIMGPSGSGKSTLMNIIGCLDIPTGGTYTLDGIDVSQISDDEQARIRNRRIGFVFQQFNLLPRTPAVKQVALPLMYSGLGRSERLRRAEEALQMVGLGERIDHRPDELSGGQQQRVAIARALVTEPAIVLADEPTGNLDSQSGIEVMEIFKRLHRDHGITLILITHDQEVADQTERTIWIRDGVVVSGGVIDAGAETGAGLARPAQVYVGLDKAPAAL